MRRVQGGSRRRRSRAWAGSGGRRALGKRRCDDACARPHSLDCLPAAQGARERLPASAGCSADALALRPSHPPSLSSHLAQSPSQPSLSPEAPGYTSVSRASVRHTRGRACATGAARGSCRRVQPLVVERGISLPRAALGERPWRRERPQGPPAAAAARGGSPRRMPARRAPQRAPMPPSCRTCLRAAPHGPARVSGTGQPRTAPRHSVCSHPCALERPKETSARLITAFPPDPVHLACAVWERRQRGRELGNHRVGAQDDARRAAGRAKCARAAARR